MAGHPNPNIYLSDHYPTPKAKRIRYREMVELLIANGWPKNQWMTIDGRKENVLTVAAAVLQAESAGDPRGYLAYVDLGVDRNSKAGLALRAKIDALSPTMTLTTFRYAVKRLGAEVIRSDNGLFQIGRPPYEDHTIEELMTPAINIRKAHSLWKERGFRPWAAYTTPRGDEPEPPYKRFLPYAREAVEAVLGE